jgi:hypothetical protein
VDIRVGGSAPIAQPREKVAEGGGAVEARLLAVRAPRKRPGGPAPHVERRETPGTPDPLTGRVLVLLIPDGSQLPEGLETGAYRVFLRFARR